MSTEVGGMAALHGRSELQAAFSSVCAASSLLKRLSSLVVVFVSLGGCGNTPPGTPPAPGSQTAGADLASSGDALVEAAHVSATGAYQTAFPIPVPSAPAAPTVLLNYSSEANSALAGVGWDLSVGYPLSITRDVRFGTPRWKFDTNWLWGSTPLVRMNPKDSVCQQGNCSYRIAPEGLVSVSINLTSQPATATVHLSNGATLSYEPIVYDGNHDYPSAPAGADTTVFAFRLASVGNRNGYSACFFYAEHHDTRRGQVADLSSIVYGLTPSQATNCAEMQDPQHRPDISRHLIEFHYDDLASSGFFPTWTLRFGAPVAFKSLLASVTTTAAGLQQDTFCFDYDGQTSETRRPRLIRIRQLLVDSCKTNVPAESQRVLRTFSYGARHATYSPARVVDMGGEPGRFPDSVSGTTSRPMQRANPFSASNIFQIGKDQDTDAAPPTFATTEQWNLLDVNGDGLPDFQWAKEIGVDPTRTWVTFSNLTANDPPVNPPPGYDPATHTDTRAGKPQQEVLINDGVSSGTLATSRTWIDSRAHTLEDAGHYFPVPNPWLQLPAIPIAPPGPTSWIWGEGRGQTRTGMPVSISAPELTNPAPVCAGRSNSQDPRVWPVYPDNTTSIPQGSAGDPFSAFLASVTTSIDEVTSLTSPTFPGISNALTGVNNGYHPKFSVASTVSGWLDLNGDGVPEFVATPAWIDRFEFDQSCWVPPAAGAAPQTPDAVYAHLTQHATDTSGQADTQWRIGGLSTAGDNATVELSLDDQLDQLSSSPAANPPVALGPAGPMPLPLSYDTSTGSSDGFGLAIPIGGLINASISSIECECWYAIAAAAPGLTVDTFSPHASTGYTINIPAPSMQAIGQGIGSVASSNPSAASVAGFIASLIKVNLDLTLISPSEKNRSESRVQVMDLNGDGLPDYLLYNSGTNITGAAPGTLVAFMNSPSGFGPAQVINRGFDYVTPPPDFTLVDSIDTDVAAAVSDAAKMQFLSTTNFGPSSCLSLDVAGCADFVAYTSSTADLVGKANDVLHQSAAFMGATTDALPREQGLASDIRGLVAVIQAMTGEFIAAPVPNLVDAMNLSAQALASDLGYLVRSVHHIGYTSHINVLGEGFSIINGSQVTTTAGNIPTFNWTDGVSYQTRGFVDLNGDGLPDYVMTDNRAEPNSPCGPKQWAVFWGTGTSSISAGTAFLKETDSSGRTVPDCVNVPALPPDLTVSSGVLPLNADQILRSPGLGTTTDSRIQTHVALIDINRDGRPDIVIVHLAGGSGTLSPFPCNGSLWVWDVFLNNGMGFSTTPDMSIPAPRTGLPISQIEPASTVAQCLNADAPVMRTTHSATTVVGSQSRDTSETHTAMIDFDGDGNQDVVRRIHILNNDGSKHDGMLVWTRDNVGGPQDLMIEERLPIQGSRNLIEYRSAANFQWNNAKPNGRAPQLGHRSLAGVPAQLVRSVTTERLFARADLRTRRGYDYKLPFFDMATHASTGFALRSSFALDPVADDPKDAAPVGQSVANTERNAQRPDSLPGLTQKRSFVAQTGAPLSETLVSYVESKPTTLCPGSGSLLIDPLGLCPSVGGLEAVFSAPARTFTVEYPTGLQAGPIFDVGFDGRDPWLDRASGQSLLAPSVPCSSFASLLSGAPVTTEAGTAAEDNGQPVPEPTGGGARFAPGVLPASCPGSTSDPTPVPFPLQYPPPPYPAAPDQANQLASSTIELWLKPRGQTGSEVIVDQARGYRLLLLDTNGHYQWQLQLGTADCSSANATCITSAPLDEVAKSSWHYLVATFDTTGGDIFEDGRALPVTITQNGQVVAAGSQPLLPAVDSTGNLVVACGSATQGGPGCFVGDLGELRVYPERWLIPPRVTDTKSTFYLPDPCRFDGGVLCPLTFGQPLVVRSRNDISLPSDDVATEYEYASPSGSSPVLGIRSTEAKREIRGDGSLGSYLSYAQHFYDGLPLYRVDAGNETRSLLFDGVAQSGTPTTAQLKVSMLTSYGADCPGLPISSEDPLHAITRTNWDSRCSFALSLTNALGQVHSTTYYGANFSQSGVTRQGPFGTFTLGGRYGQTAESIDANGATTLSTYDVWGRPAAVWSPFDRADRPSMVVAYRDAVCNLSPGEIAIGGLDPNHPEIQCDDPDAYSFRTPAATITRTWDDQLRRCLNASGSIVSCANPEAREFAHEPAPGDYKTAYSFADGQIQAQAVRQTRQGAVPAWTVSGITDYDVLGRSIRTYKVQFLPGACPGAGTWCDSQQPSGDPLRAGVSEIQQAYDVRGRVIRTYGPGWPRCAGDTSAPVVGADGLPTPDLICDTPGGGPPAVNDVTKFSYPRPGETVDIDANNVPTRVTRDARSLVTRLEEYLSPPASAPPYAFASWTYDSLGRATSATDQNNNTSVKTYDALSRVTSSTDPDLGRTTYQYDLCTELTDRISASGEKMHQEYDPLGRAVQTDYLRPLPLQSGSTSQPGPTHIKFPKVTIPVAVLPDVSRLDPMKYWPDPPQAWQEVSISHGVGQVTLPFEVNIRAFGDTASRSAATPKAISNTQQHDYRFVQGSALTIKANGQVVLGGAPIRARSLRSPASSIPTQAILTVLSPDLGLNSKRVRFGVSGTKGSRRLLIEWDGTLPKHPDESAIVRTTITEGNSESVKSLVRYDYVQVPAGLPAASGVRLVDGSSSYEAAESALRVGSNTSFSFGGSADNTVFGATWKGTSSGPTLMEYAVGKEENPTLRLGYRIFSNCALKGSSQCAGNLLVGYRDPSIKGSVVQPLTTTSFISGPLERSRNPEHQELDWADLVLPNELRGKKVELFIEVRTIYANALLKESQNLLQFLLPHETPTDYVVEERVYKTYDSSEPPYYFESKNGKTFETKPLLDVTFDVPGIPLDRSPGAFAFDSQTCGFANDPANMVTGASGRGLKVPAGLQCRASSTTQHQASGLTLEMWLKPGTCQAPGGSGACPQQSIVRAANTFALTLLPGGYLECKIGSAAARSNDPLPSDTWTHVALTMVNDQVTCFVNGVSQTRTAPHSAGPITVPLGLALGEAVPLSARPVDLNIDELRLIASSRSEQELHEDALRPVRAGPPRGNLVYLDFDHPTMGGQADQSMARNDAQISGGRVIPGVEAMSYDTRTLPGAPAAGGIRIPAGNGPSPATLALADQITAELWIKRRAANSNPPQLNRLLGKWQNTATPGWQLQIEAVSGRLQWEIVTRMVDSSGQVSYQHHAFVTHETVPDAEWHHVAATYDGDRMRVYMDGLPLHRWCGSGSLEQASGVTSSCPIPPPLSPCRVETQRWQPPKDTGGNSKPVLLDDAECISGTIDNQEPILAAKDATGPAFDGVLDELRVSNYAKREFEVLGSSRLASAYTQSLGRETLVRNRLFGQAFANIPGPLPCNMTSDSDPISNDLPYDLSHQPARELLSVDLEGHLVASLKHICGQQSAENYFLRRTSADSTGRPGSLLYPHGEVLTSQYDLDGTLKSLTGYGPGIGQSAAQAEAYIASAASTIAGQPASMRYGNGVTTSWIYDDGPAPAGAQATPSGAFGPDNLKTVTVTGPSVTGPPGATLSNRTYQWDIVGSLLDVTDAVTEVPGSQYEGTYSYDGLRRVSTAALALPGPVSTLNFAYCYDSLGNLTLIDGKSCGLPLGAGNLFPGEGAIQEYGRSLLASACPLASSGVPHAVAQRQLLPSGGGALQTYRDTCYDASGKMLWSPDRNYSYFARGKVRGIEPRGGVSQPGSQYVYDGDGMRVHKTEPGGETDSMLDSSYREISSNTGAPKYEALYVAGTNVARRVLQPGSAPGPLQTSDLYWFSNDHLTGTYFMTGPQGTEVSGTRTYYRPFGQFATVALAPQTSPSGGREFTSKELDATGLYDYEARLYDPDTGRFTQADDVDTGSTQQALNRYSYVLNNPLRAVDPTGHQAVEGQVSSEVEWQNVQDGSGVIGVPKEYFESIPIRSEGRSLLNPPNTSIPTTYQNAWNRIELPGYEEYVTQVAYNQAHGCPSCFPQDYDQYLDDRKFLRSGGKDVAESSISFYDFLPVSAGARATAWVAEESTAARGLGRYGGSFTQPELNAAGGEVFTSIGSIEQEDFAHIVQRGVMKGENVEILSGVHGRAEGDLIKATHFFDADVKTFGSYPGVRVYNINAMTNAEITGVLRGRGTIIGAFCHSGVCLTPWK